MPWTFHRWRHLLFFFLCFFFLVNSQCPEYFTKECIQNAALARLTWIFYARWIPRYLEALAIEGCGSTSIVKHAPQDACKFLTKSSLWTASETWLCHFETLSKAINKAWVPKGEDVPQMAKQCHSEMKVVCTLILTKRALCYKQGRKEHRRWVLPHPPCSLDLALACNDRFE